MKITTKKKYQAAAVAETKIKNQNAAEETKIKNQNAAEETTTQDHAVQMIQKDADADPITIITDMTTITIMHTW